MSRDVCYLRWKLLMIIVNNIGEKVGLVLKVIIGWYHWKGE